MAIDASKQYDGFAEVAEGRRIPFHFEDGFLELFLGGAPRELRDGITEILGQKRSAMAGGYTLFHLSLPLKNFGMFVDKDESGEERKTPITLGNVHKEVDYYIDGYESDSQYTQMRFSFPELDYFIPSSNMCIVTDEVIHFTRTPQVILRFEFRYREIPVTFSLQVGSTGKLGAKGSGETVSELLLDFAPTNDMEFLLGLYYQIHFLFSFLCNRQNIALDGALLVGTCAYKDIIEKDGKKVIGDKTKPTTQTFVVINKYKAEPENAKRIAKTIRYGLVAPVLEGLFQRILEDKVSIQSVHASIAARNLLDLKQCLHITAAFEFYQRTYLPKIASDTTNEFYEEIKALVQQYAEEHTGKKKEKAKQLIKFLEPEVSLQEKICKTYDGYDAWASLKPILSEYFEENVKELANVANQWRNELAHEKREYEPDHRVIDAVRLVEHLNYCIVLRAAECPDEHIKAIIGEVLVR